jgi:hypothetical protein
MTIDEAEDELIEQLGLPRLPADFLPIVEEPLSSHYALMFWNALVKERTLQRKAVNFE